MSNHRFIEVPSLDQIEAMDQQRTKAIESLEISSDGGHVKCQGCCTLCRIIKDDSSRLATSNKSGRIAHLQAIIKQSEKYNIGGGYSCKKEKEELKELLEEEKQKDILRRLPLYSSKITGYRFLCSKCYDEAYYSIYI